MLRTGVERRGRHTPDSCVMLCLADVLGRVCGCVWVGDGDGGGGGDGDDGSDRLAQETRVCIAGAYCCRTARAVGLYHTRMPRPIGQRE